MPAPPDPERAEAGVGVMPADLEAAEKAAGVRVEPGDILLVTAAPLRLKGVTGSPVNPIAVFQAPPGLADSL